MTLKQLYYFQAIAEFQNFTYAAKKCLVSQSSLSRTIQELECELNVKLFKNRGRNVELTKYGQLFLPYVWETLNILESGVATLKNLVNPDAGTIKIAGLPSLAWFASDIAVRYISETDRVNVHFQFKQEATYAQLREQLLSGKVDLIFSTEIKDSWVASICIGEHPLILLVPEMHPLAQYDKAELCMLDGEDFIAFSSDCQLREFTDYIFQTLDICPNVKAETAQDLIMNGLVAAGHGTAIIPYPLNGTPYRTKIVSIADEIPSRQLYLMWNQARYLSPMAECFCNYAKQCGLIFSQYLEKTIELNSKRKSKKHL